MHTYTSSNPSPELCLIIYLFFFQGLTSPRWLRTHCVVQADPKLSSLLSVPECWDQKFHLVLCLDCSTIVLTVFTEVSVYRVLLNSVILYLTTNISFCLYTYSDMYVDVCMHAHTERNKRERYRYTHTHQCHFQNLPQVSNISEQLVVRKTLKTAFHMGSSSTST